MNAVLNKIINQQMDAYKADICSTISKLPAEYKKAIALLTVVLSVHFSQAQLIANFSPTQSSVCVNSAAFFFDQSKFNNVPLDPAQVPIYTWTFDDGAGHKLSPPTNTKDPQMIFSTAGVWQITLDVTYNGNTDSKTGMIFVADDPIVQFTSNKNRGCMPLGVVFTDNTTPYASLDKVTNVNNVDTILNRTWDFGDGITTSGPSLKSTSHTYNVAAIYSPTLIVTTKAGCTASFMFTDMITVDPTVLASFIPPVLSIACEFPSTPVQPTNVVVANAYLWTIDGGASMTDSTGRYPNISFPKAGTYNLTLKVTSINGCENSITKSVVVPPVSNATDFSTPPSLVACQNTSFTFVRANTPTAPTSYQWYVDGVLDPNFDNKSLVYFFTSAGAHTIKMTASYSGGCVSSKLYTINVKRAPVANFNVVSAQRNSCKTPFRVRFRDLSNGNTLRIFNFGDGTEPLTEPSNDTAVHTYTLGGNFTVSLIAINQFGCSDTTDNLTYKDYIKIQVPKLLVPPTNMPDSGCPRNFKPVADFDISSQITSWDWKIDYPNSTSLTYKGKSPPQQFYKDSGTYHITLNVTTSNGCVSNPFEWDIKVGKKPGIPVIKVDQLEKCANLSFNFSTNRDGITGFQWEFSDGTTFKDSAFSKTFGYLGDFFVKLRVYNNGCSDTTDGNFKVSTKGVIANFDVLNDCANPLQKKFVDNSTGRIDYELWDFGDGVTQSFPSKQTNFLYNYTKTGVYTVSLTVKDAGDTHCEYTRTATINVANEQNISFTPSSNPICLGDSKVDLVAKVENPTMVSKYEWDLGCGFALKPASYSVDFKTLCLYSTNGGRGNYPAQLKVTDVNNCTYVTPIQNLFIGGPASDYAAISPVSGCENTTVRFQDKTTGDGVNNIIERFWDFGDGTTPQNILSGPIQYTFATPGRYSVRLTSKDDIGCTSTIQTLFVTITKPIIDFTAPTQSCPGGPIQFQLTKNVSLKTVSWDFDDLLTSSTENPAPIVYNIVGKKTIILQAEDFYGCKVSLTKPDYIEIANPLAEFIADSDIGECYPFQAGFHFTGSFANTYEWTFGDGARSFQANPTHIYTRPGTFDVFLRVTSPGGCTSNFGPYKITVKGPVGTYDFPNTLCDPNYTGLFTITSTNTKFVTINYGDGQFNSLMPYTVLPYSHVYVDSGFYQPQISITDDNFCTVPLQITHGIKAVSILPLFKPDPILPFFCERGLVTFKDISLANEPITGWEWDYGDGAIGTGNPSSHFYTGSGLYDVKFTAISASGCRSSLKIREKLVEVQPGPDMAIRSDLNQVCEEGMVIFQSQDNGSIGSPIVSYFWDFTNGQSSLLALPPAQQFRKAGTYPIKLYTTNEKGCVDTALLNYVVNPLPAIDAGNDTIFCIGTQMTLQPSGANSYDWISGPGLSCTTCEQPAISPIADAVYTVRGTSLLGCQATDSIAVHVVQRSQIIASNDVAICAGESVKLNAYGTDWLVWSPARGLDDQTLSSPTATPITTTTYIVNGQDEFGCFKTEDSVKVTVHPLPVINAGADTTMMAGYPIQLRPEYSSDVTSVEWVPSTFLDCSLCRTPVSTPQYSTTYTLFAYTQYGCMSKDVLHIYATCTKENLFIPNTFSPNNDGSNDLFYPRGRGIQKIKAFKIFNRWGQLVFLKENFFANDVNAAWDGTKKGAYVTPDVYVYMIDLICENGNVITLKGDVTLIR
jgi:gliding motility-associated-like protein